MIGLRATVNKPFGALGGFIDIAENALSPRRLGFRAWLLIGLVAGGTLFALVSGTFEPTIDYGTAGGLLPDNTAIQFALLVFAGLIMGIGARTAGGCTSGHGMSGICCRLAGEHRLDHDFLRDRGRACQSLRLAMGDAHDDKAHRARSSARRSASSSPGRG